ncbi:uncharacterized protein LOC135152139 [Daucus carota subsp. sativus]|uniref:uncharacterized protein LOC135152139 n=1 Tax=Daucus carota subsp. sativus TaxID=79200 RepID=UPI003083A1F7
MAANEYQNPTQRLHQGKVAGILDVDATSAIAAQLKALTMKVDSLTLENQIGQIANALINGAQGTLPSDTEANPGKKEMKEQQVYPPPPFPKRLQKHKLDKQFAKFLEVFKKLQINIPFGEALEQMPSYAKFMKGILSRKLKLEDLETVALTEECSAVLQQKLPPKLKDPGSFTIPCTIGKLSFDKCLCDLGASINLMPLSVFKKLGLPEPKPTNMSLQLADRSITYPRGIVEDVLVKVDKLIFPADFVILDFEEDKQIPIILGRPFLATGQTLIDVFDAMKFPTDEEECFKVEPLEAVENSVSGQKLRPSTFERVLTRDSDFEDEGVAELENSQEHRNPFIEEAPELELKLPPDLLSDV